MSWYCLALLGHMSQGFLFSIMLMSPSDEVPIHGRHIHCGQSITACSVRLMFATVRLSKKSPVLPFIVQKRLLFVIFKPFL